MILRYASLQHHPAVFRAMTGLAVAEFDVLLDDVLPRYREAELARLTRPRPRAPGAGARSAPGTPSRSTPATRCC